MTNTPDSSQLGDSMNSEEPSQAGDSSVSSGVLGRFGNSFKMSRWSQPERLIVGGTLALLLSLFMPWFSYNYGGGSVSANGLWHSWMYLVFILCFVILIYFMIKARFDIISNKAPSIEKRAVLFASAINLVLTGFAFVLKPGGIGQNGIGWGAGAIIGLFAAGVVFIVAKRLPTSTG